MASEDSSVRVSQLVKNALESFSKGDLKGANQYLREASSIDASNQEVKAAWEKIESDQHGSELPDLCRQFLKSHDDKDIEAAITYLDKHPSSSNDALRDAMDVLMQYSGDSDPADEFTGKLLQLLPAKKILARDLKESPTITFNKIFERGDDSMDCQTDLLLDPAAWESEADRIASERDVFQLALAQLMRAGQDFPERAMKALSRLLGVEAKNLNGLMDADGFDVILSNLDIRLPVTLRKQANIACVKLLELSPESAKLLISQYVVQRIEKPSSERLIQAFSAAAAVFPMAPQSASELFRTAGFLPNFVKLLSRWKSTRLEQAALELLNVACMDTSCRDAVRKYCQEWLNSVTSAGQTNARRLSQTTMANLVLEKIKDARPEGESSSSDLTEDKNTQEKRISRFKDVINDKSATADSKTTAIEGLAFASIKAWTKELLAIDPAFLKSLVGILANEQLGSATVFGIISILANVTAYRPVLSDEQKKLVELKAYANSTKPAPLDPLDDEVKVTLRCKKVLDSGIITVLSKRVKTLTPAAQIPALQILNSLSKEKSHRGLLAQQGALKLLLQTYDALTPTTTTHPPPAAYTAAHATARILISINPTHAFPSSPSPAIRPLTLLLSADPSADGPRDLLPTFEALLALTNLASVDAPTSASIIRLAWPTVENDLLLNANTQVQRAATELLCNLCAWPGGAALYTAGARARGRLEVLLALCDVEDLATRRAAAGAVAMVTEWKEVVDELVGMDKGVGRVVALVGDESGEVVQRGVVAVSNCLDVGGEAVKGAILRNQGFLKVLEDAFKTGDTQVQGGIAEIVQALK
jgi:protein unc-45